LHQLPFSEAVRYHWLDGHANQWLEANKDYKYWLLLKQITIADPIDRVLRKIPAVSKDEMAVDLAIPIVHPKPE
jgi:hypothetical protein